jgi:hypothetical protein
MTTKVSNAMMIRAMASDGTDGFIAQVLRMIVLLVA